MLVQKCDVADRGPPTDLSDVSKDNVHFWQKQHQSKHLGVLLVFHIPDDLDDMDNSSNSNILL